MNRFDDKNIPIFATGSLVIFPGSTLSLVVKKDQNKQAIKHAEAEGKYVLAVTHKEQKKGVYKAPDLARVGILSSIVETKPLKDGAMQVVLNAEERFEIGMITEAAGFLVASGSLLVDKDDADEGTLKALHKSLESTIIEIIELFPNDSASLIERVKAIKNSKELSYLAAQYMSLTPAEAQEVLAITSVKTRLLKLLELLAARKERLKVEAKIRETLSENVGKKQREAILREQLKTIQEELGDGTEGPSTDDYRKKIADASMPEEAKTVALREVSRLERMGDQSAESHVIRNYLDLLCDMPWSKASGKEVNLSEAEQILERDHYGLQKIKARILENLAVMKLQPEKQGSILLFAGPPGVGKTSLGRSIAEALGREFIRVSLGGVRDDADIRGHRRTYVGALPGRIIDGIRRAKTKDPVFILDEIDKLGRGWGGDPASALLEVLDPEQNRKFHDHYLDVPFDLSQVLFIGTANSKDTIPGPLLDRMEIIDLTGYTTDEKFHIAKQHLVTTELKEHGLRDGQVEVKDEALLKIIEGYTREAGVRSLRRELARIARAAAVRVVKSPDETVVIDGEAVPQILGAPRFELEELNTDAVPGVVTGMAWTPVGGDTLFIEAVRVPGEGKISVTGQLGDVMKESAQIAVALARIRLEGVAKSVLFKDRDIHIHVPAGAVPKDGPSAGVSMFTAVASMFLGVPVNPHLAMTGEITLRGKVLPVGGIKEKVLAAARFGIKEVILPRRNGKDLDDLPKEVRESVKFHLVSDVNELIDIAFGPLLPTLSHQGPLEHAPAPVLSSAFSEPHLHREEMS